MFTSIISLLGVFLQLYQEWKSNRALFEKSFYDFLKNYGESSAADKDKWSKIMQRLKEKSQK